MSIKVEGSEAIHVCDQCGNESRKGRHLVRYQPKRVDSHYEPQAKYLCPSCSEQEMNIEEWDVMTALCERKLPKQPERHKAPNHSRSS